MKSMTGFGRGEKEVQGHVFTVEVKTVNHRYLESSIRLSRKLNALESKVRSVLKEKISRGKTDVFINYANHSQQQGSVWINDVKLAEYLKVLREQAHNYGLEDDLKLSHVLQLPEVMETEESQTDLEELEPILVAALNEALDQLSIMREKEGENLKKDLISKLDGMLEHVAFIEERSPGIIAAYRENLEEKVKDLLGDTQIDDNRLLMEVTIFADKVCIDEELVRLRSHIETTRSTLLAGGSIGRKLDFIAQEMNREANTIGSKCSDASVAHMVVELKNEIEKIREQIQNVE